MDKLALCREIGSFFGDFYEDSGQLCIDNGEKVFRYNTPEGLLKDWLDTLIWHQHDTAGDPSGSWEQVICFIYSDVIGEYPVGIRPYLGKKQTMWRCSMDVLIPGQTSSHGKQLFLGTYSSIVDAIFARKAFQALVEAELNRESPSIDALADRAKRIRLEEKERASLRNAPVCPHCGKPLLVS